MNSQLLVETAAPLCIHPVQYVYIHCICSIRPRLAQFVTAYHIISVVVSVVASVLPPKTFTQSQVVVKPNIYCLYPQLCPINITLFNSTVVCATGTSTIRSYPDNTVVGTHLESSWSLFRTVAFLFFALNLVLNRA